MLFSLSFFFFIALLRQTDPNWNAAFFVTDNYPFEKRLQEILVSYHDSRLKFIDVPLKFRPQVSKWKSLFFAFLLLLLI